MDDPTHRLAAPPSLRALLVLAAASAAIIAVAGLSQPATLFLSGVALPDGRIADLGLGAAAAIIAAMAAVQGAAVLLAARAPIVALAVALGALLLAAYALQSPRWVDAGLLSIGAILFVVASRRRARTAAAWGLATGIVFVAGEIPFLFQQLPQLQQTAAQPQAAILPYVTITALAFLVYCGLPAVLGGWAGHLARRQVAQAQDADRRVAAARESERARVAKLLSRSPRMP